MKRLIAIILIAVICLSFAACAKPEGNNSQPAEGSIEEPVTEEEPAEEETQIEEVVPEPTEAPVEEEPEDENEVYCIISVSINPEFKLELNKQGRVIAFTPVNDDAKQATVGVNVVGMAGDDAMEILLDKLYQFNNAFFTGDNALITVVVEASGKEGTYNETIARMDGKVENFMKKNNISMAYQRKSSALSDVKVVSDTVDANGNRVLVEVDSNGVEWTTVTDSQNQMLEMTRKDPDGTVTYSDMKNNTTTVTNPDGTTSQMGGVIGKG